MHRINFASLKAFSLCLVPGLFLAAGIGHAQGRSSASFALVAEATGQAGGSVSGSGLVADCVLGGEGARLAGGSGTVSKTGFAGQLYDPVLLIISAFPAVFGELSSFQLQAAVVMDDETLLAADPLGVAWSVLEGPVSGITATGEVTLGSVYTTAPALIEGNSLGVSGQLPFNVLNTHPDNYKEYGGDGLDDDWQVANFGEPPNADAGPGQNPDGDPQDNEFEFLAGFDPNDPADFFSFRILGTSASTAVFQLNKVIPGRTYLLRKGTALDAFPTIAASRNPLAGEADYLIEDTAFSGPASFYQIEIARP